MQEERYGATLPIFDHLFLSPKFVVPAPQVRDRMAWRVRVALLQRWPDSDIYSSYR